MKRDHVHSEISEADV